MAQKGYFFTGKRTFQKKVQGIFQFLLTAVIHKCLTGRLVKRLGKVFSGNRQFFGKDGDIQMFPHGFVQFVADFLYDTFARIGGLSFPA